MQRLLSLALVLLLTASAALANTTPGNLGVATTTLVGGKFPFDQGPGTDTALGFNTSQFCIGSGALIICGGAITNAMLAGSIDLTSKVTGLLPIANGGTGTASPGLVQGTNVTITGSWPNQTINSSGGGSVSLTAGTPNVVLTPSPCTGTCTVGTTAPINAQSGNSAYTIAAGDAAETVNRTNTVTQTDILPQATGSFATGFSLTYQTNTVGNTLTSTTSKINGIAGVTGIKTGPWQTIAPLSNGTDWYAALGVPQPATQTQTLWLDDDFVWRTKPLASSSVFGLAKVDNTTITSAAGVISAVGTSGGGMFGYSDNGLTLTAGTRFVPIYGSGTPSTTEADYATKSPSATTVKNLQVNLSADPGAGQTLVVTLRKNGADQTLTCTVTGGAGVVCQDLTHSISVAQNDTIDWKVVTTGTFVATPSLTILANNGTSNAGVTNAASLVDNAIVVGDGGSAGVKTLASLGTAGQVLTSNGAGVPPSMQAASGGGFAAPSSFTNTITCGTGSVTPSSNTAKFSVSGKITFVEYDVVFPANATSTCTAAPLHFTLPNTANAKNYIGGREQAITGNQLQGGITSGSTVLDIEACGSGCGANVIGNSWEYVITGTYESQ